MIGAPFLVLGIILVLAGVAGPRVAGRERGALATFLLSPLHPAAWRATAAIVLGAAVELAGFTLVVSVFSAGTSLIVVGIGIVLVGTAIELCRLIARVERARARLADGRPLQAHAYRPFGPGPRDPDGIRDLLLAVFADPSRWRDVVYVVVALPLTMLELVVSVALWGGSLALLSVPLWAAAGATGSGVAAFGPGGGVGHLVALVLGALLAMAAASTARGLMALHRAMIAGLLCESGQRALERRVETLEGSRRAVLDVEASELQRIERDLHDGAQQRLVALALDLGLAAERIDTDPAGAKSLVVEARDQARTALAEIRNLVRGIAPAILLDRGLVAALSALAGRSSVETTVVSTLPEGQRLPDAAERAAYFVVAEALANVAKHASATRCEIRCRIEGTPGAAPDGAIGPGGVPADAAGAGIGAGRGAGAGPGPAGGGAAAASAPRGPLWGPGAPPPPNVRGSSLVVEVRDDGAGGARVIPGSGLAGLAGRVEALDGRLEVESPADGGTVVRAVIPVGDVSEAPNAVPRMAASG